MSGLPGFMTNEDRLLGTRSVNITHIIYIKKDEFLKVLKDFPKDYVK